MPPVVSSATTASPAPLEITVARGRLPLLDGVVVHRWADPEQDLDHVVIDGIPCTTVTADIPAPSLQHCVQVGAGMTYRLDMAWPELNVGLECHSRRYHFGPLKEAADHRRDLELAAAGWEVLYMTWEHRRHPDTFVPLLARTLTTRSSQLLRPAA